MKNLSATQVKHLQKFVNYVIKKPTFQVLHCRVASGLAHIHYTKLERLARNKYFNLLQALVNYGWKKFYKKIDTCGQFHKHFTLVTYKLCCAIHRMHVPMQCFLNVLAYFATVVSYERKKFYDIGTCSPGNALADVSEGRAVVVADVNDA